MKATLTIGITAGALIAWLLCKTKTKAIAPADAITEIMFSVPPQRREMWTPRLVSVRPVNS